MITKLNIAYANHQCACFSIDTRAGNDDTIVQLIKYLLGMIEEGLLLKPDVSKKFEVYADEDFSGKCYCLTALYNASTEKL